MPEDVAATIEPASSVIVRITLDSEAEFDVIEVQKEDTQTEPPQEIWMI
jgi:hypothetical protein